MTMTAQETRAEIDRLAEARDESALRDFFVQNFKNLPEQTQENVLFAFFEEALEKSSGDAEILRIQEEGLHAVDELEALKAMLKK